MKKMLAALVIIYLSSGCASLTTTETSAAVGEVISQLQIAIDRINAETTSSDLPPLKAATVVLSSQTEVTDSGEVSFFVKGGGARATTDVNTLTLVLEPSPAAIGKVDEGAGNAMADAVIGTMEAMAKVQGLEVANLKVSVALQIERTAEGGFEVEFAGLSTEGGRSRVVTTGHSMLIEFSDGEDK